MALISILGTARWLFQGSCRTTTLFLRLLCRNMLNVSNVHQLVVCVVMIVLARRVHLIVIIEEALILFVLKIVRSGFVAAVPMMVSVPVLVLMLAFRRVTRRWLLVFCGSRFWAGLGFFCRLGLRRLLNEWLVIFRFIIFKEVLIIDEVLLAEVVVERVLMMTILVAFSLIVLATCIVTMAHVI